MYICASLTYIWSFFWLSQSPTVPFIVKISFIFSIYYDAFDSLFMFFPFSLFIFIVNLFHRETCLQLFSLASCYPPKWINIWGVCFLENNNQQLNKDKNQIGILEIEYDIWFSFIYLALSQLEKIQILYCQCHFQWSKSQQTSKFLLDLVTSKEL